MVRYLDPEDHPEPGEDCSTKRSSPGQALARLKERNAALTGEQAVDAAREVALRLLDTRSRSTGEIRSGILAKGFNDAVAEDVVERLTRVGLVDDAAYARMFVRDRFELSGKTGRALVEEMTRKGLPQDTIDAALADIDPDDEVERARALVERKLACLTGASRDVVYRRLSGMLARRGYTPSVISPVVAQAWERLRDPSDPD